MDAASKRLCVFFPLAFLLSWYPWLLKHAGLKAASGGINPLGPLVAALIVAASFDGRRGIGALLGRYLRWRVGWTPLAFIFLLPLAINGLALSLNILLGAKAPSPSAFALSPDALGGFIFVLIFVGLGEETGWRGYALPWLQQNFSPLAAALLLGVIWAAWHIPLMGTEFSGAVIPAFLLSILPGSIALAWIFNRTNGSMLLPPLFHAVVNTVGGAYVFRMFQGTDLVRLWWICAVLWVIAAALITAVDKQMMTRDPRENLRSTAAGM